MNKFTTHDWNSLEQQFIAETGQVPFYEEVSTYNHAYIEWLETELYERGKKEPRP